MLKRGAFDEPRAGLRGRTSVDRLILTTSSSGAGHFEQARVADRVRDLDRGDGLPAGPFDLRLHDDADRHRCYVGSRLTITPLARRLLEGRDDLGAHAAIDRWWGGTHLTNDHLWRWDPRREQLVAPA